jgi:hypothetical protein
MDLIEKQGLDDIVFEAILLEITGYEGLLSPNGNLNARLVDFAVLNIGIQRVSAHYNILQVTRLSD